jgi:predicted kinase
MEGTMPKPLLILMCGVPFAGKTTLARAIAVQCGWQYISLDMVNTERGVGMDGQAIPLHEWEQTYAEAYRRVAAALRAGASVMYDETNFYARSVISCVPLLPPIGYPRACYM